MSLRTYRPSPSSVVSDMARAQQFYEGQLGLSAVQAGADERSSSTTCSTSSTYQVASVAVDMPRGSERSRHAATCRPETHTRGVTCEHYEGLTTDDRGISSRAGGGKVAWFKDLDGNTFAVEGE